MGLPPEINSLLTLDSLQKLPDYKQQDIKKAALWQLFPIEFDIKLCILFAKVQGERTSSR